MRHRPSHRHVTVNMLLNLMDSGSRAHSSPGCIQLLKHKQSSLPDCLTAVPLLKPAQMALLQSRVMPVSCSRNAAVKPTANMRMFVMPVRQAQRQGVQQQQTARLASRGMLRGAIAASESGRAMHHYGCQNDQNQLGFANGALSGLRTCCCSASSGSSCGREQHRHAAGS